MTFCSMEGILSYYNFTPGLNPKPFRNNFRCVRCAKLKPNQTLNPKP